MQTNLNDAVEAASQFMVLAYGRGSAPLIPEGKLFRLLSRPDLQSAEIARNVFVLVPATELPHVAGFVSAVNSRHQLRVLFVREDVEPGLMPQVFDRAGLRIMRNAVLHSDGSVPRRVLFAWANKAQDQLIAKASASAGRLFVLSCALELLEIEFDRLPALKRIPKKDRTRFTIDEDGSYLHWPGPDIHVDLEAIRVALDPEARVKAMADKARRDARYGAAIAGLRLAMGLRQSDIAGLSERQVRRIEKGGATSVAALRLLAAAHRASLDEYLRKVAGRIQ